MGIQVRIEGYQRLAANAAQRAAGKAAANGAFASQLDAGASRIANASGPAPAAALDGLLALQMVEDPLQRRRKAVRRGAGMLAQLEAIKADLLIGQVGEGRLNQLMALLGEARETTEPGLDAVIDDIELRVRVELAKRQRA